jgi:hypothetical protein
MSKKDIGRPNFHSYVYEFATKAHNVINDADRDPHDPQLAKINAAVPHRMPWKSLLSNVLDYVNGRETTADFERWTDRFIQAAKDDIDIFNKFARESNDANEKANCREVVQHITTSTTALLKARKELVIAVEGGYSHNLLLDRATRFSDLLNSYFPNVPDLGPHKGTNIQVSARGHANFDWQGKPSPMTEQLFNMTPGRLEGFPTTPKGKDIVTTGGAFYPISNLSNDIQEMIDEHGTVPVKAQKHSFDSTGKWYQ